MMAIFAAWAIPAKMAGGAEMTRAWQGQLWLALADFKLGGWITNIPRSLGYFLPWLLFLPLVSGARFSSARQTDIVRGLLWGIGLPLLIVDLIPGWLPRYGMPLVASAAWLLAATLTAEDLQWPRWLGGRKFPPPDRQRTVALITILACICISIYAFLIVPHLQKKQKVKAIAAQIDALVPASGRALLFGAIGKRRSGRSGPAMATTASRAGAFGGGLSTLENVSFCDQNTLKRGLTGR